MEKAAWQSFNPEQKEEISTFSSTFSRSTDRALSFLKRNCTNTDFKKYIVKCILASFTHKVEKTNLRLAPSVVK